MTAIAPALLWIGIYLALVLAPLLLLFAGPMPPGGGFAWDLSMAFGFAAVAMLGVQFVLTARFRRVAAPFGIDILYYFHRYMAVFALLLVFAHYGVIRIMSPEVLGSANPLVAPGYMTAGRVALLCFAVVIASSLWRKNLRIPYEVWRTGHVLLTTTGLILAAMHIEGVDYYHESPVRQPFWIAFVAVWVLLVAYVRLIKPWSMRRHPYRVTEVRPETPGTCTITIEPAGHTGIRFQPGQFAWLTLRASPFALREHPFSIASSATTPERLEFTIKNLGDFTRTVPTITPGELAYLDGPYGSFTIDRSRAAGFVMITGGVGMAPIMSMLRTMAARQDTRPVWLVTANNRFDDILFREELAALAAQLKLTVVHVLREPPPDWLGPHGLVTGELLSGMLPANYRTLDYYLCGPTPMTQSVEAALHTLGVPLAQVHSELFNLV